MGAGFSLTTAVSFLKTALPKAANISQTADQGLAAGNSLAESLHQYLSTNLYCQLLLAEKHGHLGESLNEIGQFLTTELKQRRKLWGLLQYPVLLLVMLVGMLVALQLFVFPEIRGWQNSNHSDSLPVGQWVGWSIAGVMMITAASLAGWVVRYVRSSTVDRVKMLCALPVIGRLWRLYYCYYLVTNLAVMLRHGLSLAEIGEISRQFPDRSLINHLGQTIAQAGETGEELSTILARYPFVPAELPLFFTKGNSQKQLGEDLTIFAKVQFQRLLSSLEQLLNLVQPVIFILIAIVIVGMYLSILLPIYHSLTGVY